jgi:hypothetical protein
MLSFLSPAGPEKQKSRLAKSAGRLFQIGNFRALPKSGQVCAARRAAKWFRQQHITQVVLSALFIIVQRYKHSCREAVNRENAGIFRQLISRDRIRIFSRRP